MIEIRGLTKTYGSGALAYHALRGVDLTVSPGEILMLVGPSGSGKTTLLSIAGCVLNPTSGSVRLAGTEVADLKESQLQVMRRRLIGFVFQSHNLVQSLNAEDNVALPLRLRGSTRKESLDEARELLEAVGLHEKRSHMPSQLSGGQLQRVAIARALAGRPPILLADEPTASLDAHSGQQVMELFSRRAHEGGHTVMVVTHDPRIFKHGTRICHIEDGLLQEEAHERP